MAGTSKSSILDWDFPWQEPWAWGNVGKTRINHPPVITIFIGGNVGHWLVKGGWLEESWAKIILPPPIGKGGVNRRKFFGDANFWIPKTLLL